MVNPINKFKIFKSDAAPFFFYIEIFPPDITSYNKDYAIVLLKKIRKNPIMPLPMRVDRVFNGEKSLLIRPREPITFPIMDDLEAKVNPSIFLQYGIEKLLYFTEIRAFELFVNHLKIEKINKWWESSKFLYAKIRQIEEDFSAFLKAYISTVLKAKLNNEDLINAATDYCKIIKEICENRINQNLVIIETKSKVSKVRMYREKIGKYREKGKKVERVEYHPELVDIDVYNLVEKGYKYNIDNQDLDLDELKPKQIKYIPLLLYDDLLECMLQNLKILEDGNENILDPSYILDNNIILLHETNNKENLNTHNFSWFKTFEELNFESILESIKSTLLDLYKSKRFIDNNT
ncbi:MAG: hypothetical protein ACFFC3_02690 [Candidatus Odinarchaeota archaeon]